MSLQTHGEWVWNLDLKLVMFSGEEKVWLRILYIVQSLRNSLRSRVNAQCMESAVHLPTNPV